MHGIKVLPIYGGQDIVKQIRSLKDGTQVIIGTPGRVMDHMRRKTVKLDYVNTVVLDEADEMLNMGFLEDMETILSQLPEERQTLMFSATCLLYTSVARRFPFPSAPGAPSAGRTTRTGACLPGLTGSWTRIR